AGRRSRSCASGSRACRCTPLELALASTIEVLRSGERCYASVVRLLRIANHLRCRTATVALALPALLVPAGSARAQGVRVFVVGHKQRVQDATSVASFRAKMFALVDAQQRAPDLVQAGADDVASHLAPRDPAAPALAVVHFPESTGLIAGLIGSRGAA